MSYSFPELMLSMMVTIYVTVSVVAAFVRWGHKCAAYAAHTDYYYPAWKMMVFCFLTNVVLLPVAFMPNEPDALLHLRMMLILSSPYLCAVMIFSYFGRVMKVGWWRMPVYSLTISYLLVALDGLVLTLIPGTQLQGEFLRTFFIVGTVMAVIYLICYIIAMSMIITTIRRLSEDYYSNTEDFPVQFAEGILWIPILHLIMSWSTTFNGAVWALSFGLFVLSVLCVVFLVNILPPHRSVEVEQLESGADPVPQVIEVPLPPESKSVPSEETILSLERKDEIEKTIRHYVEDEKAYLESHLNLATLSRNCGINRTYISMVLTERFGGFFSYVNCCRLAHADAYKKAHPQADIDDVSLASGFNNRQSYYNARKRLG